MYREAKVPGFEHSEGTEAFTKIIDRFDALNVKLPSQGIRPGSEKIQVINQLVIFALSCLLLVLNLFKFLLKLLLISLFMPFFFRSLKLFWLSLIRPREMLSAVA